MALVGGGGDERWDGWDEWEGGGEGGNARGREGNSGAGVRKWAISGESSVIGESFVLIDVTYHVHKVFVRLAPNKQQIEQMSKAPRILKRSTYMI